MDISYESFCKLGTILTQSNDITTLEIDRLSNVLETLERVMMDPTIMDESLEQFLLDEKTYFNQITSLKD